MQHDGRHFLWQWGCHGASTMPLNQNERSAVCNARCVLYYFCEHTFFRTEKQRSTSPEERCAECTVFVWWR